MAESRSLYSVIPARVRDDRELRPNAKLLYGELSALAQAEGYCWASNAYLAELFDLAPKTVEALLRQLKERGHIQIEVERDPDTNEVIRRKIWICGPPGTSVTPSPQNRVDPPLKNEGTSPQNRVDPPLKNEGTSPQNRVDPPLKNEEENNINIIIKNKELPPIVPQGGKRASKYDLAEDAKPLLRAYCGEDQELARALADLIDIRRDMQAINSKRAIKALLARLDDLSGGDRQTKLLMIQQSVSSSWKSVFPLKGGGRVQKPPDRIQEEEGTYLL